MPRTDPSPRLACWSGSAEGGNRTHTGRSPPDFESGASASSATSAWTTQDSEGDFANSARARDVCSCRTGGEGGYFSLASGRASSTKEDLLRKKPLLAILPIAVAAVGLSVAGAASGKTGPTAASKLPSSSCSPIFYKGAGQPAIPHRVRSAPPGRRACPAAVDGQGHPVRAGEAVQVQGRHLQGRLPVVRRRDRSAGWLGDREVHGQRSRVRERQVRARCARDVQLRVRQARDPDSQPCAGRPGGDDLLREHGGGVDARRAVERPGRAEHLLPDEDPQLRPCRGYRRLPGPVRGRSDQGEEEEERLHPPRQPDVRQGRRQRLPVASEQARHRRQGLRAVGREGRELRGDR